MKSRNTPLAIDLLKLYRSGMTVNAISAFTGLPEFAVMTRLCVASRLRKNKEWADVPGGAAFRVQWEFVSWRN